MKEELRKYFFSLRKNKYFNLKEKDFKPLLSEIARHNKNSIIGSYYSINFELDLKILNTFLFTKGFSLSLPFIHKDNEQNYSESLEKVSNSINNFLEKIN